MCRRRRRESSEEEDDELESEELSELSEEEDDSEELAGRFFFAEARSFSSLARAFSNFFCSNAFSTINFCASTGSPFGITSPFGGGGLPYPRAGAVTGCLVIFNVFRH